MTYYRFRVAGREARDISTVFNSALSRRGGKSRRKSRPRRRHQSQPILGNGRRHNLPAPGCTRTPDPDPIRFANEADLLSPAGWKNDVALPRRSSSAAIVPPPPPPLSPARTNSARRSEAITRLPARKSPKVSDYFRESLVLR